MFLAQLRLRRETRGVRMAQLGLGGVSAVNGSQTAQKPSGGVYVNDSTRSAPARPQGAQRGVRGHRLRAPPRRSTRPRPTPACRALVNVAFLLLPANTTAASPDRV